MRAADGPAAAACVGAQEEQPLGRADQQGGHGGAVSVLWTMPGCPDSVPTPSTCAPPPEQTLPTTMWRVDRATRSEHASPQAHTLEDTPFYARSMVRTQLLGAQPARATGHLAYRGMVRAVDLPAALRALKLQKRAARVGFDWPSTDEVLDKIVEESRELVEARDTLGPEAVAEEFGDLMFVMVNLGRHLGVDAEAALRGANEKFTRRFKYIEAELKAKGSSPDQSDLAEMDALWDAAKRVDKGLA